MQVRACTFFIILRLLLLTTCLAQVQESEKIQQHLSFSGAFITRLNRAHRVRPFRHLKVDGLLSCGHACMKYSQCSCFNYEISAPKRGLCELNDVDISSHLKDDQLKERPGFIYVQPTLDVIKARSCLDHKKAGARFSQKYTIYDREGIGYEVFCDLTSEPRAAWTLIMSEISPGVRVTQRIALYANKPFQERNVNWDAYRLPLRWMEDLKAASTHWRVTCSFPLMGAARTDHVRAKLSQFDLINFRGKNVCMPVELINVRGHACLNCTAAWSQRIDAVIHQHSGMDICEFGATTESVRVEDSFGFYDVSNPKFRCTNPGEVFSSTNHWIGGYL